MTIHVFKLLLKVDEMGNLKLRWGEMAFFYYFQLGLATDEATGLSSEKGRRRKGGGGMAGQLGAAEWSTAVRPTGPRVKGRPRLRPRALEGASQLRQGNRWSPPRCSLEHPHG